MRSLTYNGTTLTVVITDTVTKLRRRRPTPSIFLRSSAGRQDMSDLRPEQRRITAIQDILNWTYSGGADLCCGLAV